LDARRPPAQNPADAAALGNDEPFSGDPAWRVTRTLRDGTTITIRPITPDDREELRREFERTSAQTRYLRFLGAVGELSEATLTYLTDVDQKNHIAIVATTTSPDLKTERGVGVARVIRLQGAHDVAEAAITVRDDMQKLGVGSALALELERAARANGIRHIRADVLENNALMRSILEAAGAEPAASESAGTISYDIAISGEPTLASRLTDVLRGAAQTMAITIRKLVPPDSE
jgi:GNAT superfamily N-acetyltransferase